MGRAPSAKEGEVKVQWGKDEEGLVLVWGDGASRADAYLIADTLRTETRRETLVGLVREPALLEELERRGYDVSTLRLSIRKKA